MREIILGCSFLPCRSFSIIESTCEFKHRLFISKLNDQIRSRLPGTYWLVNIIQWCKIKRQILSFGFAVALELQASILGFPQLTKLSLQFCCEDLCLWPSHWLVLKAVWSKSTLHQTVSIQKCSPAGSKYLPDNWVFFWCLEEQSELLKLLQSCWGWEGCPTVEL